MIKRNEVRVLDIESGRRENTPASVFSQMCSIVDLAQQQQEFNLEVSLFIWMDAVRGVKTSSHDGGHYFRDASKQYNGKSLAGFDGQIMNLDDPIFYAPKMILRMIKLKQGLCGVIKKEDGTDLSRKFSGYLKGILKIQIEILKKYNPCPGVAKNRLNLYKEFLDHAEAEFNQMVFENLYDGEVVLDYTVKSTLLLHLRSVGSLSHPAKAMTTQYSVAGNNIEHQCSPITKLSNDQKYVFRHEMKQFDCAHPASFDRNQIKNSKLLVKFLHEKINRESYPRFLVDGYAGPAQLSEFMRVGIHNGFMTATYVDGSLISRGSRSATLVPFLSGLSYAEQVRFSQLNLAQLKHAMEDYNQVDLSQQDSSIDEMKTESEPEAEIDPLRLNLIVLNSSIDPLNILSKKLSRDENLMVEIPRRLVRDKVTGFHNVQANAGGQALIECHSNKNLINKNSSDTGKRTVKGFAWVVASIGSLGILPSLWSVLPAYYDPMNKRVRIYNDVVRMLGYRGNKHIMCASGQDRTGGYFRVLLSVVTALGLIGAEIKNQLDNPSSEADSNNGEKKEDASAEERAIRDIAKNVIQFVDKEKSVKNNSYQGLSGDQRSCGEFLFGAFKPFLNGKTLQQRPENLLTLFNYADTADRNGFDQLLASIEKTLAKAGHGAMLHVPGLPYPGVQRNGSTLGPNCVYEKSFDATNTQKSPTRPGTKALDALIRMADSADLADLGAEQFEHTSSKPLAPDLSKSPLVTSTSTSTLEFDPVAAPVSVMEYDLVKVTDLSASTASTYQTTSTTIAVAQGSGAFETAGLSSNESPSSGFRLFEEATNKIKAECDTPKVVRSKTI